MVVYNWTFLILGGLFMIYCLIALGANYRNQL
jgi:hypothetical protein